MAFSFCNAFATFDGISRKCRCEGKISPAMLLAMAAAGFLFALVVLLLSVTSAAPAPPACPDCGVVMVERLHPGRDDLRLPKCQRRAVGPVRYDFSWWDAGEAWVREAGW